MGRDIDFASNVLSIHGYDFLDGSAAQPGVVISHNVKSHRTGHCYSDDYYEDYGVLLWMDKNGNLKSKGKKYIYLEGESYQPRDFVKTWEVPVEVGDYGVKAISWFGGSHPERSVEVFRVEKIVVEEGRKSKFCLIPETIGSISYNSEVIPTRLIHEEFDEIFLKGVKKATKMPKEFKAQKGYGKYFHECWS